MSNQKGFFSLTYYISKSKARKNGECPVFMRITIDGERVNFRIKRHILPENWDSQKSRWNGRSKESMIFNDYLYTINMRANKLYSDLLKHYPEVTPLMLKDAILGVNQAKEKMLLEIWKDQLEDQRKLVGKDLVKDTFQRYVRSRTYFQEYLQKYYRINDIRIQKLSPKMIKEYEVFLKTVKKSSHNTTVKFQQHLKRVVYYCISNGWLKKDPFYGITLSSKDVARPYLTEKELKNLMAYQSKVERINNVRDFFVFSCFTGLSYIDVKKLSGNEIEKVDNQYWIRTSRQKTGVKSNIPILPVPLQIIKKYVYIDELCSEDLVLPIISNQKMNAYLKELANLCGIDKELSYHVARHTFATTVTMMNGVPIESVSRMLGHKKIQSTQHYARIVDQKVEQDMAILNSKLEGRMAYAT